MSAPLPPGAELLAPIDEMVGEKGEAPIRQPRKRRPKNIAAADANGPYLIHTAADLRRQNPAPDLASGDNGTHDVSDEILADAYRRGLRVRFWKKIRRKSLGFLFGDEG